MSQACPYPGSIECPELGVSHLAACHQELAVTPARHMASDGNVIGLVSQDQPRLLIGHENFESIGVGGIAASNAVLPQGKDVLKLGDGPCIRGWRQGASLSSCELLTKYYLVDLGHGKARDLDWGIL